MFNGSVQYVMLLLSRFHCGMFVYNKKWVKYSSSDPYVQSCNDNVINKFSCQTLPYSEYLLSLWGVVA